MEAFTPLHGGVALAELGGYGDGPFCARHGAGAALVTMGTYVIAPEGAVRYHPAFSFPPHPARYQLYLQEHVRLAHQSGARVAVSAISLELAHTVDFLAAAAQAGADFVSLCAHSTMPVFLEAGLGAALCRRERWSALREWVAALQRAVPVPLIVKMRGDPAAAALVEELAAAGVLAVHANVGTSDPGSPGLRAVAALAGRGPFLIVSGGVKDLAGAQRVVAAGADLAAVGRAAVDNPRLLSELQAGLQPTG